ncbi:UNVERIFIED_CONTAM: hypothetical protein NCL1_34694 [Trichonephila clavipes]
MDNYPLIWIFRQLRIVNSQPAKNLVIPSQVSRPFTRLYKAKEDLVLPGTFGSLSDERRSHVEKKGRPGSAAVKCMYLQKVCLGFHYHSQLWSRNLPA